MNRYEKRKARKRYQEARQRVIREERRNRRQFQEATPEQILSYISKLEVQPGKSYIIAVRVTTKPQEDNGDSVDQMRFMENYIESQRGIIVDRFTHVGPGDDSSWLIPAGESAKITGATIATIELSRFCRHPKAHKHRENYNLRPREKDLKKLRLHTQGQKLATYLDPLASEYEVWSLRSKIGQKAKGRKGGRPKKRNPGDTKKWRLETYPKAIALRENGLSLNAIALSLGIKKSTVQKWVEKHERTLESI